jgi:hypothetical protein
MYAGTGGNFFSRSIICSASHWSHSEVHVWTLNQVGDMLLMIERGVQNLITDHPDVAVRLLRERAELSDAEKLALSLRALFGKEEAAPGGAN